MKSEHDFLPAGFRFPGASHYSGLSTELIKKLVREGKIDSVKVGRARIIPRAALDKLLTTGAA